MNFDEKSESEAGDVGSRIGKIHDRFVASFLKNPLYAADFLSSNLDPEIAESIDWTRLTVEPTAFADEKNRLHFADLAFAAPFKNAKNGATFFLLLEHKSSFEKTLPLQLLKYIALQANSFVGRSETEVDGRWPCPIAFVLHNGATPWKKAPRPRDVLYAARHCERFIPDFDYILLDLAATDAKNLRGGPFVRVFLELLKRATDGTLKSALKGILRPLGVGNFQWNSAAKETTKSFWQYVADVARNLRISIAASDIEETIRGSENEGLNETMKTFIDEYLERGRAEGREEGRERGRAEGRAEGREEGREEERVVERRRSVVGIVCKRFGATVSDELVRRIETIADAAALEKLFNFSLDAPDVATFERFVGEVDK